MKIKVCGMKHPGNMQELNKLPVDFMGMIFYEKSSRYIVDLKPEDMQDIFREGKKRVGVFVNANMDYIIQNTNKYELDLIQLHGNESPDFCRELNKSIPVIKAFSISGVVDIEQTKQYEGAANYFLFDTKTFQYGGSGKKFDWSILNEYKGNTPFILSGGISVDDAEAIKNIKHSLFFGIDLNSRFEIEPGLKDMELLKQFIIQLKNE